MFKGNTREIVDRAFALHMADLGLILDITYGPSDWPGVNSPENPGVTLYTIGYGPYN